MITVLVVVIMMVVAEEKHEEKHEEKKWIRIRTKDMKNYYFVFVVLVF